MAAATGWIDVTAIALTASSGATVWMPDDVESPPVTAAVVLMARRPATLSADAAGAAE
jgi:hypothetical protein